MTFDYLRSITRPFGRFLALALCLGMMCSIFATKAYAQDADGSKTGTAANSLGAGGATFTAEEIEAMGKEPNAAATKGEVLKLADATGQGTIAINLVWMLVCGFLVMFMQAGFAMVEAGFCRAKHAAHVFMTNFAIYPIGMLGFWICGFAIMYGSLNGEGRIGGPVALGGLPSLNGIPIGFDWFTIAGTKGFFLEGQYDVMVYGFFLFQMVFMDTTATIPTGAMAERWRFTAFIVYGFFVSMLVYPVYGHMVWGGGGLAMLGAKMGLGNGVVDFAGSSVVHMTGGFLALAGAIVIGPRIGKYVNGKPVPMPGHHIPMALVGSFILAFGWFGFNAGSMLGASGGGNLRLAIAATNTMLASAGGALFAILYMKLRTGKYDPSMAANGMLAGLVGITAPCAFVNSPSAVAIGIISSFLVMNFIVLVEKLGVDDPCGAFSVHGIGGMWGTISVGLFADGVYGKGWNLVPDKAPLGIFFGGGTGQLFAQLIGCFVCVVWAFGMGYLFFTIQGKLMRLRPSAEDEINGLDLAEMGALAYPEFPLKKDGAAA